MVASFQDSCPLCHPDGETVLFHCTALRVVHANEPGYTGFCRVIWNAHRTEMTELSVPDRQYLMAVVFATERSLRQLLVPHKINLASLGNQVPHLHWHVIPRFRDDPTFPDAVWAPPRRAGAARALPHSFDDALGGLLRAALGKAQSPC